MLAGPERGRQVRGFDYHYETYSTDKDGGRTTHHHYFSALVFELDVYVKPLLIRSETFFDKIGEFFGADDIDFESDRFSREFFVKSPDRRWAFDVIGQSTMEFLLAAPRFTIQFGGLHVIAFRDALFEPVEFEQACQVLGGILDRIPPEVLRKLKGATP